MVTKASRASEMADPTRTPSEQPKCRRINFLMDTATQMKNKKLSVSCEHLLIRGQI